MYAYVSDSSGESDSSDDSDIEGEATSALFMVRGFKSSVQFLCISVDAVSLDYIQTSLLSSVRRSALPQNVEAGVVPRAAPEPEAVQEHHL